MFSVEGSTNVLFLVGKEHGHKEVAPTSHTCADQVKLLELDLCLLKCPVVSTGYRDKVGSSLSLQEENSEDCNML